MSDRIGCVVCWLDPQVTGDAIKDVNVIYDGNGYCTEHWSTALGWLRDNQHKTIAEVGVVSTSLPMYLAGLVKPTT